MVNEIDFPQPFIGDDGSLATPIGGFVLSDIAFAARLKHSDPVIRMVFKSIPQYVLAYVAERIYTTAFREIGHPRSDGSFESPLFGTFSADEISKAQEIKRLYPEWAPYPDVYVARVQRNSLNQYAVDHFKNRMDRQSGSLEAAGSGILKKRPD